MTQQKRPAKASNRHLDPQRVTPLGMMRYSIEYFAAAEATDNAIGDDDGYEFVAPSSITFLMGRAIELALKAYLISRGTPREDLTKRAILGHDLQLCLQRATDLGLCEKLDLSNTDLGVLKVLNAVYREKQLEYFVGGFRTLPVFGPLQDVAKKIMDVVLAEIEDGHLLLRSKAGAIYASVQS